MSIRKKKQSEIEAKKLTEYMMKNYPNYRYSNKSWIVDEPDNPYFGEHRRILELEFEREIILTLDADFCREEVGELVNIVIRYVSEEQENIDWVDLTVKFR